MASWHWPSDLPAGVRVAYAVATGLLLTAALVPQMIKRFRQVDFTDYYRRLSSWVWVIGSLMLAVAFGRVAVLVLFALVSLAALREFLRLLPVPLDRGLETCAYGLVLLQYALLAAGRAQGAIYGLPATMVFAAPLMVLVFGHADRSLPQLGGLFWGVALAGWSLSHVAALEALPLAGGTNPAAGITSLLFLVILGDVLQYLWGRAVGRHLIVPVLSPRKTWEGLVLGALSTGALALSAIPELLNVSGPVAFALGVATCVGGFAGDITLSAIKRHAGVKDTGTLLPGMGGIFDRADSLVFTAPIFFHVLAGTFE